MDDNADACEKFGEHRYPSASPSATIEKQKNIICLLNLSLSYLIIV
jgi:hypothetical protein